MAANPKEIEAGAAYSKIENLEVKLSRTKTHSGLETKSFYGPADAKVDYQRDLGDPGQYPYTRGSYPEMYRSRMWTLRNIVGYGSPEDTRDGITKTLQAGGMGLDVVVDSLTQHAVDPDHPAFGKEAGLEGCSLPSVRDVMRLTEGIDVTKIDIAWHWCILAYPTVAAAAIRTGHPIDRMQGSCMPDHLRLTIAGWGDLMPAAMGHRTVVDLFEYCAKNSPRFTLGFPQGYDFRENGAHAITEIAIEMAILIKTVEDLIARGTDVDSIAPRLAYVSSSDIDFFEEIAKFRALRRIWARTMKERLGAQDPKSLRLRIACHTSGRSLVYRQPLNNLARAAVQSLAALLGGVQSLEACTYDEPICVPTPEARELATRTQQILAAEVGAARTADPLGGSYYIEALTNEIESKALDMLAKLEAMGIVEAISTGYVAKLVDEYNNNYQHELDCGERLVIGLNAFAPDNDPPPKRFTFDKGNTEQHRKRFAELKTSRDQHLLRRRIRELYATVKSGQNATQAMIDALLADGSVGEVWGTVRVAHGHSYDLFRTIESPFDYSGL